ncbi:SAM-dependent methyltransferase [Fodinicola acaciae]|uniref:SAM-dependent methyltransferase n=1 Tax=Fodinicola acaciae TaxID=2681555 RepID=UPI0013D2C31B|nr:SAM-dependent methyltransferase [Fodinicola acaciae]
MSSAGESAVGGGFVPGPIDTTKPSHARVFDLFLGGKDNFEVDRAVFNQISQFAPALPLIVREQRKWLVRVVRFLAGPAGVDQFLDCGSGLPTTQNTHEIAQQVNSDATVVYVDNDPVVIAHGKAVLEENDRTHFIGGDLSRPDLLLNDPAVTAHLDFDRPVGLLHVGIMHLFTEAQHPVDFVKQYLDRLAPGSYYAMAAMCMPEKDSANYALGRKVEQTLKKAAVPSLTLRSYAQLLSYVDGLELLDPGLVKLSQWWPDGPAVTRTPPEADLALGVVARKP